MSVNCFEKSVEQLFNDKKRLELWSLNVDTTDSDLREMASDGLTAVVELEHILWTWGRRARPKTTRLAIV